MRKIEAASVLPLAEDMDTPVKVTVLIAGIKGKMGIYEVVHGRHL